ncbi:MAG: flippase [Ardenticatenaceae bacterium]|nr:flippase [Ardenticatenaceae bacterium]
MQSITTAPVAEATRTKHTATSRQIRGSSLLLVGKFFSIGVNFAVQILIVRHLSKSAYGAFAYALSIVSLGETIATFGLDRAITRFVPIYHEQHDFSKLFGTIIMVVSTILSLGLAMVLLVFGLQGLFARSFISDQQALTLLLILIVLAPIQALDGLLDGMFAVFAKPRAIFFRKYILGPGLKLSVVLLLILGHSTSTFLAAGYLASGTIAVAVYTVILFQTLRTQGLFQHFDRQNITIPAREILSFTIPLLTSDLVYVVMNTMDAVLLERFQSTVDVAALRAVQPTAKMNQFVLTSFTLLFTPLAARLFAKNDRDGINNLYWQTAIWIAVISFPVFALTFSLARPLTLLLYGARYEQSAIILALLSFAYYFNAALGQNGLTLKVFGMVRYIVIVDVLATIVNLGVNLLLIPRYGALGAAIGTASTLIAFNIFKQAGLAFGTGITLFDPRYFKVYASIAISAFSLFLVQLVPAIPPYVDFALAAIVSLLVLRLNRKSLNVEQTFPELLRFPLAQRLLRN